MGARESTANFETAFMQVQELMKGSLHFSKSELMMLFERFYSLSKGKDVISKQQLTKIPEMQLNPLADRIADMFVNDQQLITFESFVRNLNSFHVDATIDEKIQFVFRVFDMDGTERISKDNLFKLLQMIVGETVQPVQLQMLANCTLQQASDDASGVLTYEQFKKCLLSCNEINSKLTVKF